VMRGAGIPAIVDALSFHAQSTRDPVGFYVNLKISACRNSQSIGHEWIIWWTPEFKLIICSNRGILGVQSPDHEAHGREN
jgi:hypothetical protein